jgi:hypothetical protein
MALAVIGGLVFSTILSLVFVPAMFMVMDDLGSFIWRHGLKLVVSSAEDDHGAADKHQKPPAQQPPAPKIMRPPAAE